MVRVAFIHDSSSGSQFKSVSTQDTFKTFRRALPKFAFVNTILVLNIGGHGSCSLHRCFIQIVHNLKSVSTQDTFKTVRRA